MNNIAYYLAMTGLAVGVIFSIISTMINVLDHNPLTYPQMIFPLPFENYHHGDGVTFPIEVCSTRKVTRAVTRQIHNLDEDKLYLLSNIELETNLGCHTIDSVPLILEDRLPFGTYRIEYTVTVPGYRRDFVIKDLRTEEFRLVPKEESIVPRVRATTLLPTPAISPTPTPRVASPTPRSSATPTPKGQSTTPTHTPAPTPVQTVTPQPTFTLTPTPPTPEPSPLGCVLGICVYR